MTKISTAMADDSGDDGDNGGEGDNCESDAEHDCGDDGVVVASLAIAVPFKKL